MRIDILGAFAEVFVMGTSDRREQLCSNVYIASGAPSGADTEHVDVKAVELADNKRMVLVNKRKHVALSGIHGYCFVLSSMYGTRATQSSIVPYHAVSSWKEKSFGQYAGSTALGMGVAAFVASYTNGVDSGVAFDDAAVSQCLASPDTQKKIRRHFPSVASSIY